MGDVIAFQKNLGEICRSARRLALQSLTRKERIHVVAVENDKRLMTLFDSLQRDFFTTGWFVVPSGYSSFETEALKTMHRFTDEVTAIVARCHEIAGPLVVSPEDTLFRMPAR